MASLNLLSTQGCHLCSLAIKLLNDSGTSFSIIDIVFDDQLVKNYGDKIPVLIADNAEQALFWPFDIQQIEQYKEHYGIS